MPRAKEQRLCTRVKLLVIFIKEAVATLFDLCDRENVHFISRKAYVSDSSLVEAANFAEILCFQNRRSGRSSSRFAHGFHTD